MLTFVIFTFVISRYTIRFSVHINMSTEYRRVTSGNGLATDRSVYASSINIRVLEHIFGDDVGTFGGTSRCHCRAVDRRRQRTRGVASRRDATRRIGRGAEEEVPARFNPRNTEAGSSASRRGRHWRRERELDI